MLPGDAGDSAGRGDSAGGRTANIAILVAGSGCGTSRRCGGARLVRLRGQAACARSGTGPSRHAGGAGRGHSRPAPARRGAQRCAGKGTAAACAAPSEGETDATAAYGLRTWWLSGVSQRSMPWDTRICVQRRIVATVHHDPQREPRSHCLQRRFGKSWNTSGGGRRAAVRRDSSVTCGVATYPSVPARRL